MTVDQPSMKGPVGVPALAVALPDAASLLDEALFGDSALGLVIARMSSSTLLPEETVGEWESFV